jgi:hypothetical protein
MPNTHPTADPRIVVVTPHAGQIFAPGDTLRVHVSLQAPLQANYISVSALGLGDLQRENYNSTTYDAKFTIPNYIAGPITLQPAITDTNNTFITGPAQ